MLEAMASRRGLACLLVTTGCSDGGDAAIAVPCDVATDNNTCSKCSPGYYLEQNQCKSGGISNCLTYQTSTSCQKCGSGYFVDNGTCKQGAIRSCVVYSSERVCEKCEANYIEIKDKNNSSICFKEENERHCKGYFL